MYPYFPYPDHPAILLTPFSFFKEQDGQDEKTR